MPHHIFLDIRRLLMDFVSLLDKHSIGNEEREEANRIIEELTVLMKDEKFVEHLETEMEQHEHQQLSDDIADEILSRGCPNGNCDV
tara:strand:+ start:442 stop:699 length:258 start_codon:yes stop_codon:yes gene_type:complete